MNTNYAEANAKFISTLIQRCDDRGFAASLRRYWSDTTRHQALPSLGRLGAINDKPKSIVAALAAVHPSHVVDRTLGKAALKLGERNKDGDHPYDRHFLRILACADLDDLAPQLLRFVRRLSREGFALDYALLLQQLYFWNSGHDERVKTIWAKDFWQAPSSDPTTP